MPRRPDVDLRRLRWRMRGAWMWPTFVAATVAEAVLLTHLPVWGEGPEGGIVAAGLLAACLNLIVVAVLAPAAGLLARRRRRDLPRAIARDYAGTVLLCLLLVGLVAGGLAHRGERQERARGIALTQVSIDHYVRQEQPRFQDGLTAMDTIQVEEHLFRGCVPGPPGTRPLCVFVRTRGGHPTVTPDGDRIPNALYRSRNGF